MKGSDSGKGNVMKVRLIRHAQSAANAGLATTDPHEIPLTELGRLQAQDFAARITSSPDLIISSRFKRAIHTVQPTALRFPNVPVEMWAVEEFTYLSPNGFVASTQEERKPYAEDIEPKAVLWRIAAENLP